MRDDSMLESLLSIVGDFGSLVITVITVISLA